ncbi:MAG: anti-sigma factor family protein [Bryobacteraceae bacterium]
MTSGDHLTNELLVRAIDDELPESEAVLATAHLSHCLECKQKYQELAMLSSRIETLVAGIALDASFSEREALKKRLEPRQEPAVLAHSAEKMLRRFGWGMAIAATLAIGVTFAPRAKRVSSADQPAASQSHINQTFEVDGETFVALPYSNADLPLNASHIMQMRIPVSSLAAAGVTFEPISSEVSPADDSVLADVLLGIDGQPLGVHVTGVE